LIPQGLRRTGGQRNGMEAALWFLCLAVLNLTYLVAVRPKYGRPPHNILRLAQKDSIAPRDNSGKYCRMAKTAKLKTKRTSAPRHPDIIETNNAQRNPSDPALPAAPPLPPSTSINPSRRRADQMKTRNLPIPYLPVTTLAS
jgi:hypothetical protein